MRKDRKNPKNKGLATGAKSLICEDTVKSFASIFNPEVLQKIPERDTLAIPRQMKTGPMIVSAVTASKPPARQSLNSICTVARQTFYNCYSNRLDNAKLFHVMRLESIIKICNDLNSAGIRYLMVGGLAVIAHGYARFTMDLDMVVSFQPGNIRNALKVFAGLGYCPRVPVELEEFSNEVCRQRWITEKNMVVFSLINLDPDFPVIDLFVQEPFNFDEEYERAEAYQIGPDIYMPVVSLATLIRMKEKTGREKDNADVSSLRQFLHGKEDEKNRRS